MKFILLILTSLVFTTAAQAEVKGFPTSACEALVGSETFSNISFGTPQKNTHRFFSANRKIPIQVTTDHFLGSSTTKAYLKSTHGVVVKVDTTRVARQEAQFEVLATEYLRELGYPVPEILDYSNNVFNPYLYKPGHKVVIVKRYWPGLNQNQRSEIGLEWLFQQDFMDLVKRFEQPLRDFPKWLRNHHLGQLFLEEFGRPRPFDLYGGNWLLTDQGWILIDP